MLSEQIEVVLVEIETPRGSLAKRRADRSIDFLSPVPCPFNYGSVVGTLGADGDPVDAVVLGPPLAIGQQVEVPVWGRIAFVDDGVPDPKLVCADSPPTAADWRAVRRFFTVYGTAKRWLNRARGRWGTTGISSRAVSEP